MTTPASRSARRLLRRSRSAWVSVCVLVAAVAAAWVGLESARFALGLTPLLATPLGMLDILASGSVPGILAGAAGAVFGILCLWGAASPGRAGRRLVQDERAPIVIDDAVLAGGLSRDAADAAAVAPAQVRTRISRRRAAIDVVPSSGFRVDPAAVEQRTAAALGQLEASPALAVRARVARDGVLS